MTTKELIDTYPAWICKGDKTYVAVSHRAFIDEALKIANSVFKVKLSDLEIVNGYMRGDYIYKGVGVGNCKLVWIVEVK